MRTAELGGSQTGSGLVLKLCSLNRCCQTESRNVQEFRQRTSLAELTGQNLDACDGFKVDRNDITGVLINSVSIYTVERKFPLKHEKDTLSQDYLPILQP